MRKIATEISGKEAFKAFKKVFKNADPFNAPFNENIVRKHILMPEDYHLTTTELYALKKAAAAVGEKKAFYSLTEGSKPEDFIPEETGHWEVDLGLNTDFSSELWSQVPPVETAIYSKKGTWGVIISHEWHAVLGGSEEFIREFGKYLNFEQELEKFLKTWQFNQVHSKSNIDWLPKLMNHVYGSERTQKLLLKYGLSP